MGIVSDIFSPIAGDFVKSVGDTVRSFVTTDKDRAELDLKLQTMQADFTLKLADNANAYESQITQRQQNDMQSNSWLSKNIRPLTLIFILGMYSILSISSAFQINVTESYVTLLGQWGMLIMSFYFGGRTLEKLTSIAKG